jgi:threonine-phosphate decarboxylase
MALIHGGDTEGYRLEYGRLPLDFSANCNPLGVPEAVQEAICNAAAYADTYCDPLCRELCCALSQHLNILPEQILCGNGAADLIYRLALALKPKTALITIPTFAEYELALATVDCRVKKHKLEQAAGFRVTERILEDIKQGVEILFLCNPNNPTGLTVDIGLLECILKVCKNKGTLLVVDECFNGFLAEPQKHSLINKLVENDNLMIIDAFTKLYGMAGVRLGYCLCNNKVLLEKMSAAGQPWAVSALAQAAGIVALQENAYIGDSRKLIQTEKDFLLEGLQAFDIKVQGSEANYIFFYSKITNLAEKLCNWGILIRDCSNYEGLCSGYYRIAVRRHDENMRLLAALEELAGEHNA